MGDDSLRYYKMASTSREDGFAQRGYAYTFKQSQNCNNGSKFEENLFDPYLKGNPKNRPNLNQTKVIIGKEMLKKIENRKNSPSVIAKLMGINEIPPEKGLYGNIKSNGGSFRKIPEFKDVFEVIEERKKQKNGKGQIGKKIMQNEKFGDNFESYRDQFVKNLEKSNPLFAKHLLELKFSPPHLHKNPIFVENPKMRNLRNFNVHESNNYTKMRNLGKMGNYDYNHDDDIVILDPKFGNFDLGPNLGRSFKRNFPDDFENRRVKNEKYEGFQNLRKFKSSLGIYEKEPKTLAEMLALSDSENVNSRNNNKKVSKVRSDRNINYEKEEGSSVILPRYSSSGKSSLYEREDVVKLRGRNKKLRENFGFGRKFTSSRFREEDIYARKDNLRGFSENNPEIEKKMLFTIDEEQKVGIGSRCNYEQKQGRFSKYCDRIKMLKQVEQPSPVSVLEPGHNELDTSSSSFVKEELEASSSLFVKDEMDASSSGYLNDDSTLYDSDTQIIEEPEMYITSDEETKIDNNNNNNSTLNVLKTQEEGEFSYLLDMLIQSGLYGPHLDTLRKACHSKTSPINPHLFNKLENKYNNNNNNNNNNNKIVNNDDDGLTWSKGERRLLFDLVNWVLGLVLEPCLDPHPWVRIERRIEHGWGPEGLVEKVWLVLERERRRERDAGAVVADDDWLRELGDDVNVIGKRIERMITDEILEETVFGFLS